EMPALRDGLSRTVRGRTPEPADTQTRLHGAGRPWQIRRSCTPCRAFCRKPPTSVIDVPWGARPPWPASIPCLSLPAEPQLLASCTPRTRDREVQHPLYAASYVSMPLPHRLENGEEPRSSTGSVHALPPAINSVQCFTR